MNDKNWCEKIQYDMILYDIKLCKMIRIDSKLYNMIRIDTKLYEMIRTDINWCDMIQWNIEWNGMIGNVSIRDEMMGYDTIYDTELHDMIWIKLNYTKW